MKNSGFICDAMLKSSVCILLNSYCTNLNQVDFVIQQLSDEDDFKDVKQEVIDLAGRWQDLGSSLGIRMSDMETIQSAHASSPSDCLSKMLTIWLRQSYKVCACS